MEPEVRLLVERAAIRRMSLEGLLDVIPDDLWDRREPGEAWSARNHLQHLATADILMRETVEAVMSGAQLETSYMERRAALIEEAAGQAVPELRARMAEERARSIELLKRMDVQWLEAAVVIPAAVDAFGRQVSWPLRTVVTAWAEHDTGHEMAIRAAVTSPPDAGSLAAAARFRR